jgi:hypothetical protein
VRLWGGVEMFAISHVNGIGNRLRHSPMLSDGDGPLSRSGAFGDNSSQGSPVVEKPSAPARNVRARMGGRERYVWEQTQWDGTQKGPSHKARPLCCCEEICCCEETTSGSS